MANKRNQIIKLLESNGFYLKRHTKHAQYFDGITRITVPNGNSFDWRMEKMIELQIRDAVAKRSETKKEEENG